MLKKLIISAGGIAGVLGLMFLYTVWFDVSETGIFVKTLVSLVILLLLNLLVLGAKYILEEEKADFLNLPVNIFLGMSGAYALFFITEIWLETIAFFFEVTATCIILGIINLVVIGVIYAKKEREELEKGNYIG